VITLHDPAHKPLRSWKLRNARPKKYTGPALGGNANEVAMEELVVSAGGIELG
jgi:phage tail-like protein